MAPEALRGFKYRDEIDDFFVQLGTASDVWSLGCVLYEIVCGQAPFRHIKGTKEKIRAILSSEENVAFPPEPKMRIPVAIWPVIERILKESLQKNPSKRCSLKKMMTLYYKALR